MPIDKKYFIQTSGSLTKRRLTNLAARLLTAWTLAAAVLVTGISIRSRIIPTENDVSAPDVRVLNTPNDPTHTEASSLSIGGYHEIVDHSEHEKGQTDIAIQNQEKYLKDKAELEAAIAADAQDPYHSNVNVAEFASALERIKQIPNKIEQIEALNTWVNNFITYDYKEMKETQTNMDHRTLLEAIRDRSGICDEIARVKLFGLEQLGFNENNIRWVGVNTYRNNKLLPDGGHAVTVVRLGGQAWVLNNNADTAGDTITFSQAEKSIISSSVVEPSATFLNFSGNSSLTTDGTTSIPTESFNSQHAFLFSNNYFPKQDLSNVPEEARNAGKETSALTEADLNSQELKWMVRSAFAGHDVQDPIATSYDNTSLSSSADQPPAQFGDGITQQAQVEDLTTGLTVQGMERCAVVEPHDDPMNGGIHCIRSVSNNGKTVQSFREERIFNAGEPQYARNIEIVEAARPNGTCATTLNLHIRSEDGTRYYDITIGEDGKMKTLVEMYPHTKPTVVQKIDLPEDQQLADRLVRNTETFANHLQHAGSSACYGQTL